VCPICGLAAPVGYGTPSRDNDDPEGTQSRDYEAETVSQSEDIHSALQEILSTLQNTRDGGGPWEWIWIVVVVFLMSAWSGSRLDRFTDRVWYSLANDTDWKNVTIMRRPSDCDFLHAPIGTKRCSYKKTTVTFGEKERQILIGLATTPEEKAQSAKEPNSVTVDWEKKAEP